ncbi:hypothetical protein ACFXGT_11935 [Streptomyces sp. NPDC059352]|uniref:hypothetical protein n=1 Tax=Streptomyces sp. NPDC059352 TaxID=3346810 RepID=UPI0036C9FDCA
MPLQYAGGGAAIHHCPDVDACWFTATAANRHEMDSEAAHASFAEVTVGATEFLLAHALPARQAPA